MRTPSLISTIEEKMFPSGFLHNSVGSYKDNNNTLEATLEIDRNEQLSRFPHFLELHFVLLILDTLLNMKPDCFRYIWSSYTNIFVLESFLAWAHTGFEVGEHMKTYRLSFYVRSF